MVKGIPAPAAETSTVFYYLTDRRGARLEIVKKFPQDFYFSKSSHGTSFLQKKPPEPGVCSGDLGEGYMQKFFNFPYLYGLNPIRIVSCRGINPVWNYFLYGIVRSDRQAPDVLCRPYI
jgi:hypothetical protein